MYMVFAETEAANANATMDDAANAILIDVSSAGEDAMRRRSLHPPGTGSLGN